MRFKMIVALVLLGAVLIFTLQNTEVIGIKFLFWEVSLSRVLMVFLILLAGITIGWFLNSLSRYRRKL